jgi:hypothetical protein
MRRKKVLGFPFRAACLPRVFTYGDYRPHLESKPARAGLQTEHGIWPSGLHAAKRISYICCVGLDWRWQEERAPPVRISFAASAGLPCAFKHGDYRPCAIEVFSLRGVPSPLPCSTASGDLRSKAFHGQETMKERRLKRVLFFLNQTKQKGHSPPLDRSPLRGWDLRRTLPRGRAVKWSFLLLKATWK